MPESPAEHPIPDPDDSAAALLIEKDRRKHVERDLREVTERFELAIRGTAEGLWDWNTTTDEVWYAPRFRELLGYEGDDLENFPSRLESFRDHLHPDDAESTWTKVRNHLECGDPYDTDYRLRTKSGDYCWFRARGTSMRDNYGKPIHMAGSIQDITEERAMTEALRQSQERFALAARSAGEGLWDWEVGTEVVWYSPVFFELLDYASDELPQRLATFNELLHPDDFGPTWDQVRCHLEEGAPFDVEYRLRTKSGAYRWFRARGASSRDSAGKAIRMAGSIQDITEQRKSTIDLEDYAQRLQVSNEQLQQFAYVASHDLQAPLRSIGSFAGLIRDEYEDQLDEQAKDWLQRIVNNAERMTALTQDLLAYARVESRASSFEEVSAEQIVNEVVQNLDAEISENSATVTCDPLPTVYVDHSQLIQVFQNLIGNAIKFRGTQPPQIRVSVTEAEQKWCFSVHDNGIGIDEQYCQQVFEVFRRLHSRDAYEGTGIGLAICRRVVARHGGTIWVESGPGQGSTFNFSIFKRGNSDGRQP